MSQEKSKWENLKTLFLEDPLKYPAKATSKSSLDTLAPLDIVNGSSFIQFVFNIDIMDWEKHYTAHQ